MWFRRYFSRAALVVVVAAFFVFLGAASAVRPWRERLLERGAGAMAALRTLGERLAGLTGGSRGERLMRLERERVLLLAEIARRESTLRENETLRRALTLRDAGEAGVLPALIIGVFREGREEFVLLNRGTMEGIGVGDPVIGANRVLGGTVVAVGERSSRALLLSSASQSIDVFVGVSSVRAIARGNNNRELVIELVPPDAAIQPGDLITASPRSTGGRSSLLVGEVREIRPAEHEVFKAVRAVHLFDPSEDDVFVLLAP